MRNDFEKQVREKMDELDFVPSQPVWTRIEEQIRKKKDRRRLVLWLPLLITLLTGGGLFLYYTGNNDGTLAGEAMQQAANGTPNSVSNEASQEKNAVSKSSLQNSGPVTDYSTPVANESAGTLQSDRSKESGEADQQRPSEAIIVNGSSSGIEKRISTAARKELLQKKKDAVRDEIKNSVRTNNVIEQPATVVPSVSAGDASSQILIDGIHSKETVEIKEAADTKEAVERKDQPAPGAQQPVSADSNAKSPSMKKVAASRKWVIAVTAGAGFSGVSRGFQFLDYTNIVTDQSFIANQPVPYATTSQSESEIKKGFAFGFGLSVGRAMNNRLTLSSGLRYQYFSNAVSVYPSAYNTGLRSYIPATTPDASDYFNNYHFIGLPLSAEWKVNRNLPLFLNAGITVQRLLSTNALAYNKDYQLYFRSKNAFNNTQLFAEAGASYGVRINGLSFNLGPQLQYGISRLEKSGNKHVYALGLKAGINL